MLNCLIRFVHGRAQNNRRDLYIIIYKKKKKKVRLPPVISRLYLFSNFLPDSSLICLLHTLVHIFASLLKTKTTLKPQLLNQQKIHFIFITFFFVAKRGHLTAIHDLQYKLASPFSLVVRVHRPVRLVEYDDIGLLDCLE